ncbi:MlaD family protein [Nocardioides daejeonensis]|uniref:MlaD family protein n=1 Tax=Nocardioides daejeonensis TaxID=1046556 RepID=UPI0013A58134|nr:MlaD family protein [Nocardioides daejeonensis]
MEKGVKAIAVKFGIFALIAVLLFIALFNTMTNDVGGKQHTLYADFTNISGLRQGDDIRISGVKVGRVEGIEVKDNHLARVTMKVQSDQQITNTTHVTMRYQNLLGQKYLALTPDKETGKRLKDGDTMTLEQTSPGFDLTALLNGFEPLFNVLSPRDMNLLAENIVAVLQGESGSVESLLSQTADLTSFLADRDEVFDEVVTNLTPVVENLASNSDEFDTALTELRKLVAGLNEGSGEFFGALSGIRNNLDATTELISDLRPSVSESIAQIRALGDTIRRGSPIITKSFDVLPLMTGAFVRSMSYGSHLQVYNCSFGIKLIGERPLWIGRPDGPHSEACK